MIKIWEKMEHIVYAFCRLFFSLMKKELTDENFRAILQFVKFVMVGISNTIVSYVIYLIALFVFRSNGILGEVDYLAAQTLAFVLSVLWSFYWNDKKVFVEEEGVKRNRCKALAKTYLSYAFTGLFLNNILLVVWIRVLHISKLIAPLINLLFSVPINFAINKFWAFSDE